MTKETAMMLKRIQHKKYLLENVVQMGLWYLTNFWLASRGLAVASKCLKSVDGLGKSWNLTSLAMGGYE